VSELEARLRFYFNALNAFDLKAVETMFAENAIYVSSGLGKALHGRDQIMNAFRKYFAEFNDQVSVDTNIQILERNVLRSDWHLKATSCRTSAVLERAGTQVTTFNDEGSIVHIEVQDQ
jgi:ketosteroid isomerase-like protein